MLLREAADRRGRRARGSVGLLDREPALREIDGVIEAAGQGSGRALLFEGHAGIGKTRLHEAALDSARADGMRVLRAAGSELESEIALGVARALLEAQMRELPSGRRRALLDRAPERVRALAGLTALPDPSAAPDPSMADATDLSVSHGLFSLLASAEETRPALIAVDDLQWCDGASLDFILYLLHRLEELPIALVLSRRHGTGEPVSDALDRIASHPRVAVVPLKALGREAVCQLTTDALGEKADGHVIDACYAATSGNPFYLRELLAALEREPQSDPRDLARHARALAPEAVIRTLRVRVGRIGQAGIALARSLAVLGDDTPLRQAAALAGLTIEEASAAADALAAVEIVLAREPLRFVHQLVRHAITNDIPASELASRHLDAARKLAEDRSEVERIAAHLLVGRAEGDDWVVEELRTAARDARARAAPQSAVRYLTRALDEPPSQATIAEVLAELGGAQAAAGAFEEAAAHLEQAIDATADHYRQAELALERGHALYGAGRYGAAAACYDAGVRDLAASRQTGPAASELHDELQSGFTVAGAIVDALRPAALERSRQLLVSALSAHAPTHGQRLVLAQAALHASLSGEPASSVTELALRAWDEGQLLRRETAEGMTWLPVAASLCMSGEIERSIEVADEVLADARRRGAPLAFATASYFRATPKRWQGQIADALADLELARDARRYGWQRFTRSAAAVFCLCLIEAGELERAERVLTEDAPLAEVADLEDARRQYALAELRLAQERPRDALDAALVSGAEIERTVTVFGFCPWRSAAARAALALGDVEHALELARAELESSERSGALHARVRALRVLGLCEPGDRGLGLLREASELGCSGPPRLEAIRALIDFGAALRRSNQRAAAREPLKTAADLALAGGATALHMRARTELAAAGARPRRSSLTRGPASLTPSELRIAELAADGHSNREIAQILFVTPKTVEYHLRNVYRKLEIASRRDLARVLVA